MALLKCFCFNDQKCNNKLLGERERKKKNASGFWAKNTCPYFGHCLDIGSTITSKKTWKLSSLDLLKVFLFRRFPFLSPLFRTFCAKLRWSTCTDSVGTIIVDTWGMMKLSHVSSHTTSFPTHVCTIPHRVIEINGYDLPAMH